VIQLIGEYVVEIAEAINTALPELDDPTSPESLLYRASQLQIRVFAMTAW